MKISIIVLLLIVILMTLYFLQDNVHIETVDVTLPITKTNNNVLKANNFNQSHSLTKELGVECQQELNYFLRETRIETISVFLNSLKQEGVEFKQLIHIAREAGLAPMELLTIFPSNNLYKNEKIIDDELLNMKFASVDEQTKLESIIVNQNESSIRDIMGAQVDSKIYDGAPLFTFTFRKSIKPNNEIVSVLEAQGLSPTLLDVVYAIKHKKNSNMIIDLIQYTKYGENIYWRDADGLQSISLAAARQFNHIVLRAWLNKTNSMILSSQSISELDLLPIPINNQIPEALATVEVLLNYGRSIRTSAGFNRLLTWMPEDWLKRNIELLSTSDFNLSTETQKYTDKLGILLYEFESENSGGNEQRNLCQQKSATVNLFDKKYQEFQFKSANNERRESLLRSLVKTSFETDLLQIRNDLINSIIKEEWDKTLDLIPMFLGDKSESLVLDSALEHAIKVNAPTRVVRKLLERGANLPVDSIHTLAWGGYQRLASDLLFLGLDINFVNDRDMTAIDTLVHHAKFGFEKNNNNMLIFLINNGVTSSGSGGGLDSLNHVLMSIEKSDVSIIYAKTLVDHGAIVKSSHLLQIERLKIKNNLRYLEIINSVPELYIVNE